MDVMLDKKPAELNKISDSYEEKISNYLNVLEILSQSTDDFLFLLDIARDENWFFGPIDHDYALRDNGKVTNTLEEMMDITYPADREAILKDLKQIVKGKKDFHDMEYRWVNRQGKPVWISCRGKVINDENGKPFVMIGRVSEEALRHLFNPLTGLFNKNKMIADLKKEMPSLSSGYFMLVDIDELAAINIIHGRDYGDILLKELARAIEEIPSVRNVYHTEHNYFGVILDVKSDSDVQEIYNILQSSMHEKCTITAGVVPMSSNAFIDENNLYSSAKITLKKAKNKGKNSLEFFSAEEMRSKVHSIELLEELQESVKNNFEGFYINYQPQVKAGSYNLFGTEALIRYKSKVHGRVFPDEFIPLLEQTRLIEQVGLWVLEEALLQCKKWREFYKDLHISVNFSTVQFRDKYIVDKVLGVLEKTDMPGDALTIEITESMPLHEIKHFSSIIKHLKASGIQIAIDDFGTGYSNIGYLKLLDLDEIKIDKMFVKAIEEDTYNYKLICNTIEFAKMNSIRVCCEGIENERELAVLEGVSSDVLQGYLFDKPCDACQIEKKYLDSQAKEYDQRTRFINKLYRYKEKMGVIHFDPKDILRETNVGLWVIRINENDGYYEMHADETMERIMGINKKYTPQECYDFWHSRIREDYAEYVKKNVQIMTELNKSVQLQYPWKHPIIGEVIVRCTGRRVEDCDGMIVLEGYHRILSDIEEM